MACTAEKGYFCSQVASLGWIFFSFFSSRQGWQSTIEKGGGKKVVGRNGSGFDVQMAPGKVFCWENSRFCCDVKSSKRRRRFNKLLVWHGQHVGVGFRSKSSAMLACQIPVRYETAIQNSMTLGIGEKWFLPRWRHPFRLELPAGILPLHQADSMPFSHSQLISNQF